MMWWYGNGMGVWGYTLMAVSSVLFWGLLVFGVVVLVRYFVRGGASSPGRTTPTHASPEQILAQRFAAGEIDEEEYRQRLDILHEHGPSRPIANP